MTDELAPYLVEGPTLCVGEVIGYLGGAGGWIDEMKEENGRFTLLVRMPPAAADRVEKWVEEATGGKAHMHRARASNDEDIR